YDPEGGDGSAARKMSKNDEPPPALASFDLDSTLITPRSGNVFSRDASDWRFLDPSGKSVSGFAAKKGAKAEGKEKEFKGKVLQVARQLKVPLLFFVAVGDDEYRKPRPGMFEFMQKEFGPVDLSQSFLVGDAAGRAAGWKPGRKKDFSDSDRKFAMNVGIRFYTPEEFFAGEDAAPFELKGFDPTSYSPPVNLYTPVHLPLVPPSDDQPELVVLVGSPGSGKSTFARTHFESQGYVIANQDTLKTVAKCMDLARRSLLSSKSVVVDATNRDAGTRASWIQLATAPPLAGKVKQVRCVHFTASKELCKHNGAFRAVVGERGQLPDIAYNTFWSSFEEPSTEEGFAAVIKVGFVPDWVGIGEEAENEEAGRVERKRREKLWRMRLT
ncbi:hypothetical protein HDU93_003440, partial [Gonapodya sp. JEL0774]